MRQGEIGYFRPGDQAFFDILQSYQGYRTCYYRTFNIGRATPVQNDAYVRAREGEEIEIEPRPLWVESLEMIARPDPDHVELEMVCGKGGYVRSVARDLGRMLGCHGHVLRLRRTWSGAFDAADGITLDRIQDLAKTEALDAFLRPLEDGLSDLPEVRCTAEAAARLRNGNPAPVISSDAEYGDTAWAAFDGHAVAVGTYRSGELHPSRVFRA